MSFLDSLDGSDLYSSDMKSSNEKPKKENAALKVAENKTEALNMYLESDSARLMRTSIEKSSAPESQVEEQRENAMNEKKTTLQDKDSKTQEQNTTNQQSSTATSTDGSAPRKPQSTPSATTNEKKPLILPSHAKQKGNASKKVAQYWESEAAVDVNTRRQRYRNPHVTVDAVPSWEEYSRNLKPLDKAPLFAVDENINDKVTVYSGSVVQMEVDAIVNAANESCMGGGGVDGAVHTAAGKLLLDECKTLQGCAAGKAKITRGYNLPAQYIIHTVGPKNQNETVLRSCYQSCLQIATEFDIRTIAFCCVGVGIYGYPLPAATKVALETVRKWMETEENRTKMDKIIFVVFNDREKAAYEDLMPLYFPTAQLTENLSQKQDEEHKKKLEKELEEKAKQEEKQRLEEEKKREEERKRLEAKKQEEEMKEQEKIRKEEEQRKQKEQDERLRKEAETKRLEQERKQKEQEERSSKEAESKRIEEERKKKEEEERKLKEAVAKKQEEERKAKEEVERKQREAKKLEEEKKQKEAEAKKIEEERKKEQEDRFRKEVEAKRIEEENRKKEQERLAQQQQEAKMKDEQTKKAPAQTTVQTQQPIPSEQKPTKPQPTLTPTPTPTPEPSQGMNSYLLIGGLVGTTLITVAAFLLLKRR